MQHFVLFAVAVSLAGISEGVVDLGLTHRALTSGQRQRGQQQLGSELLRVTVRDDNSKYGDHQ
jgi:hypothetical protein